MLRDLTEPEFKLFQAEIYRLSGIHYPQEKRNLLSNRVKRRLRALSKTDYRAYLCTLRTPSGRSEVQQFLNTITTNETYFYRCQRHWDFFEGWLRDWSRSHAGQPTTLRLWSAAASTGAEAYTALICARELLGPKFGGHRIEVLGTDLNDEVLDAARKAQFGRYAVAQMDQQLVQRYFTTTADGEYQLAPKLAERVRFKHHNLMEPLDQRPFDFIFVRNVMIYFDTLAKERLLDHANRVLKPGGYMLVGEAESLLSIQHAFEYVKPSVFLKPSAEPVQRLG